MPDEPSYDQKIIQAFDKNVASFPRYPYSTSADASCGTYRVPAVRQDRTTAENTWRHLQLAAETSTDPRQLKITSTD